MPAQHSTYFAYGARIPNLDPADMQEKLRALKAEHAVSVGYLLAGDYDADATYLVTECTRVEPGKVQNVDAHALTPELRATWDGRICMAADALDTTPLHEPSWLVIPDLS